MSQDLNKKDAQDASKVGVPAGQGYVPQMPNQVPTYGLPTGVPVQGNTGGQAPYQGAAYGVSTTGLPNVGTVDEHQQRMIDMQKELNRFLTTDDEDDVMDMPEETKVQEETSENGDYLDSLRANFFVAGNAAVTEEEEKTSPLDIAQMQKAMLEQMIQANAEQTEMNDVQKQAMNELLLQQQALLEERMKKAAEAEAEAEAEAAPWLLPEEPAENTESSEEDTKAKSEPVAEEPKEEEGPQFTGKGADFLQDTTVVSGSMTYNDMGYGQLDEVSLDIDNIATLLESPKKKPKKKPTAQKLKNKASDKDRASETIKAAPQPRPQKVLRRKMAKTGTVLDKHYINIAEPLLHEISPARKVPYIVAALIIAVIVGKFGFWDIISEQNTLRDSIANKENEVNVLDSALKRLEDVKKEIALFDDHALTEEEKNQVDILERLEIFETEIMSRTQVASISISGNTTSTALNGLTLDETRNLLDILRKRKYVTFAEVGSITPLTKTDENGKTTAIIDPKTGEVRTQTSITITYALPANNPDKE